LGRNGRLNLAATLSDSLNRKKMRTRSLKDTDLYRLAQVAKLFSGPAYSGTQMTVAMWTFNREGEMPGKVETHEKGADGCPAPAK
jgi:hypothetical protein